MSAQNVLTLPLPRSVEYMPGVFAFTQERLIRIDVPDPSSLLFTAERFQTALCASLGLSWEVTAGFGVPHAQVGLTLRCAPTAFRQHQGYLLEIGLDCISITGRDAAGVFYGVCTLVQLLEHARAGLELPCQRITDWPDFPARGVMLDISRDKVPTMGTLYELVDLLANWKINQLQLYTEHTFAYRNHPEVWALASPMTGHEILALDAYCRQRFIELVPNQNSFGHMHRWLRLPRYAPLAELHGAFQAPWGQMEGPFSLCPVDPGSLELMRSIYDDLLPHFSSRQLNVGADETFDVGQGRSHAACEQRGEGRVYLDYLLQLHRDVTRRGHVMQFWGDIILRHPDLIGELPHDLIALEWGYEADHPFDQDCTQLAASGIPFYVCPGTSSWNSLAGRSHNALGNLMSAARNGLAHGAVGYLNTDWGDNGHWQPLPVSYLGYAAGAAYSWAVAANRDLDIGAAISLYAFRDPTGVTGRVAHDLGNVYRDAGLGLSNSSGLFWALQWPRERIRQFAPAAGVTPEAFRAALDATDSASVMLAGERMARSDSAVVRSEFEHVVRMLRQAAHRGLMAMGEAADLQSLSEDMDAIIGEHARLWLVRNREGGLQDSLARFRPAQADYATHTDR